MQKWARCGNENSGYEGEMAMTANLGSVGTHRLPFISSGRPLSVSATLLFLAKQSERFGSPTELGKLLNINSDF